MAVLLFHGGHLRGGYLGVDLFFTLSGFLITSLLLAEAHRDGGIGLGHFWARRARRLLPAVTVMMLGVAAFAWFCAEPAQLGQIRGDSLATLGYVANWHQIFGHQSYFALFTGPSPLQHTWSLAIEEQFYVIWPLLVVALVAARRRGAPAAALVVSVVLAASSGALMIVLYDPADTSRAYFGTDTRAAAILLGAALAAWLRLRGPTSSRRRRVVLETFGVAGVAVLAVAWTRLDGQSSTLYRGGFLVCGLCATAVIAAAVHPRRGPISVVLSFRPLRALGLISYGVYLYHWPLDVYLDRSRLGFGGWPLFGVRTAVTLVVAIASYFLVEQPIRRGALSSVQLRALVPAVAVLLVVSVVATTSAPVPDSTLVSISARFPPRFPRRAPTSPATPARIGARAVRAAPPRPERVMVVGNSVAYLLGKAFEQLDTHPRLTVFDGGLLGCVFPPEVQIGTVTMPNGMKFKGTPCDPPWERDIVRGFKPQVVFWIVTNPMGTGGDYLGHHIEPCTAAWDALYEQSLTREIGVLQTGGTKVVITTAAYTRYVFTRSADRPIDCDNAVRRRVAAATGAQLVDLFEYICPGGQCRDKQDGVTLRPDGIHYTGPGGEIVARWLLDQVRG